MINLDIQTCNRYISYYEGFKTTSMYLTLLQCIFCNNSKVTATNKTNPFFAMSLGQKIVR